MFSYLFIDNDIQEEKRGLVIEISRLLNNMISSYASIISENVPKKLGIIDKRDFSFGVEREKKIAYFCSLIFRWIKLAQENFCQQLKWYSPWTGINCITVDNIRTYIVIAPPNEKEYIRIQRTFYPTSLASLFNASSLLRQRVDRQDISFHICWI